MIRISFEYFPGGGENKKEGITKMETTLGLTGKEKLVSGTTCPST